MGVSGIMWFYLQHYRYWYHPGTQGYVILGGVINGVCLVSSSFGFILNI